LALFCLLGNATCVDSSLYRLIS